MQQNPEAHVQANPPHSPWYRSCTVGIEMGPTGSTVNDDAFMSRMTGRDIVEKAQFAGAEYLILFCKDMEYAYYPSRLRPMPPALQGRDLLQEVLDAARGTAIQVIAYAVCQYDTYVLRQHPEWELIGQDGQGLGRVCLRHPGYAAYMERVLAELMHYEIAGFHIDMMDLGFSAPYGCWCEHCQSEYRRQTGRGLPRLDFDDPHWKRAHEFRYESSLPMVQRLTQYVKRKNPQLSIDFNYHGTPPFSFEVAERPVQHAQYGDFVSAEGLPWIFGYNNVSMAAHMLRAARPDGCAQMVGSRSIYNYHEYTVRPSCDLLFEVMTAMALGCTYTLVDKAGYDGKLDELVYQRLRPVFARAKDLAQHCIGYENAADCAVFFSQKTRDYHYRQEGAVYNNGIAGTCRMLVQSHIPYTFLFDENLTLEQMRRFRAILLPNAAVVSARETELFDAYVRGGGSLLCLGPVAICNEQGAISDSCVLGDVLGIRYEGVGNRWDDTYLRFPANTPAELGGYTAAVPGGWDLYVRGGLYAFSAAGARTVGELCTGFRPGAFAAGAASSHGDVWDQLMSADRPVCPGIFVNRYGRGTAVTVPCMLPNAYMDSHRSPEQRELVAGIIRELLGPMPVEALSLPLNTEMMVNRDADSGRLLVHFVTFNGTMPALDSYFYNDRKSYPPLMEEPACYRARLRIREPYARAWFADGTAFVAQGDELSFATDRVHECLILEPQGESGVRI